MTRAAIGAALVAALSAGCASFDGRGLVPGKSTAAEVRALMGTPADSLALPGGSTALYFSRLPEGRAMFVAMIGSEGVLLALEQRLTRENIAKLVPGTSTAKEVREVLDMRDADAEPSGQLRIKRK